MASINFLCGGVYLHILTIILCNVLKACAHSLVFGVVALGYLAENSRQPHHVVGGAQDFPGEVGSSGRKDITIW